MITWNELVATEESITSDQVRKLMESGSIEHYQVIDVRQPKEYEQSHVPGALLMPLPDLSDRVTTLDPQRPAIVYCRSGVRSKAGCQVMLEAGLQSCYNLVGGILKWEGVTAVGPPEFGLECFIEGDFSSTFSMAYRMEANLQKFYLHLAATASHESERQVLNHLASFEESHMALLANRYKQVYQSIERLAEDRTVIEGGIDSIELEKTLFDSLGSTEEVLHLAMKLETQAYDLYSKLSRKDENEATIRFYKEMAQEELRHLRHLAKQLDKRLEN